ncbi:hypothetical protein TNCV_2458261 [Trichonephila clavipes]|nr:hypothetical protein TNCV_2458261 [Trichonephila clavipes]
MLAIPVAFFINNPISNRVINDCNGLQWVTQQTEASVPDYPLALHSSKLTVAVVKGAFNLKSYVLELELFSMRLPL